MNHEKRPYTAAAAEFLATNEHDIFKLIRSNPVEINETDFRALSTTMAAGLLQALVLGDPQSGSMIEKTSRGIGVAILLGAYLSRKWLL